MIKNNSENPVTIEEGDITTGAPFTLLTVLPLDIPPLDSIEIRIQYGGGEVEDAFLDLTIQPCASQNRVRLASYSGSATLSMPEVVTDPRSDTTAIPIRAQVLENVPYRGVRFYEGAITVNPRLYLAREITTTIGTAEIISQDIIDGLRVIRFRVNGMFSGNGEIARLIGYAGMAEVDVSPLEHVDSEAAFGSTVDVTYTGGLLTIVHPDPDRRIVDRSVAPIVRSISPNPSSTNATLTIDSPISGEFVLRILDQQGVDLVEPRVVNLQEGNNEVEINVTGVPTGMHHVLLTSPSASAHATLVVVR